MRVRHLVGHLFLGGLRGGSQGLWKYRISDTGALSPAGRINGRDARWDDQFSVAVGNLAVVADDQNVNGFVGAFVAVHDTEPDSTAPEVRYVSPVNGAVNQALTSRIGVSFSSQIELASVDTSSFIVRAVGEDIPLAGSWGSNHTVLNFWPHEPLESDATYEIVIPANGITDLVGNALQSDFRSTFSTLEVIGVAECGIERLQPVLVGQSTTLTAGSSTSAVDYAWNPGDGAAPLQGSSVTHDYLLPGRYPVTLTISADTDPQVTQAETAVLSGGVIIDTSNSGYTGSGFIDYPGSTGSNVKANWQVDPVPGGLAELAIRYTVGGGSPRGLQLWINNEEIRDITFPATGEWTNWQTVTVANVPLDASVNTIELRAVNGAGPNIDSITIAPSQQMASASCTATQIVHAPLTDVRPVASGPFSIDAANDLVWVVNPDNDSVSAINTGQLNKRHEVAVGRKPVSVAGAPDGDVWVINQGSATISIIDSGNASLTDSIALAVGARPFGIVFSPIDGMAYVALEALGQVVKINPLTRRVVGVAEIQADNNGIVPRLRGLAISADNRLLATRFISNQPYGSVYEVNPSSMQVMRQFQLANDPGPDTPDGGRGVPNYLSGITISPDGKNAWIPSKKDNLQRGVQRDGLLLSHDNTVRTVVSRIDLAANREVLQSRIDLNDHDMAFSVVFSPLGDLMLVAVQGTNVILVFDTNTGEEILGIPASAAPQGMAIDDQGRLYIHNFLSRSVSVYDVNGLLQATGEIPELLAEVALVENEKLTEQELHGKQIFYNAASRKMTLEGYISCASCHLDGGHDGQVWDFTGRGEGLRNTITLRGRSGMGHGPLHWSGNFDEMQDFESVIRGHFGGRGFINDEQFFNGSTQQPFGSSKAGLSVELDALAAYVESLSQVPDSPYRDADGSLTNDGSEGRSLFAAKGCASCHGGDTFTDSATGVVHDIGTLSVASGQRLGGELRGIDTPTLLGVWATAPYLHDGSAATLEDAVRAHSVLDLTNTEIQKLAAFLKQLDDNETAVTPDQGISPHSPTATFSNPTSTAITLNGDLTEWVAYTSFGADADDIADNEPLDWQEAWMAHDSGYYYLAIRNQAELEPSWGQTLYIDTDSNSTTGFNSGMPMGADYVIQGQFVYRYAGDGSNWQWDFLQMLDGSFQQGIFEYRIPKALLDNATTLTLGFVGSNVPYGGTTEDVYPDTFYDSNSDNRTFTYTADAVQNSAPEVNDQTFRILADEQLNITLAAADFDDDNLTYTILTQPEAGSLSGTAPELSYLPLSGFEGTVQFTYKANDGVADSAVATVQISVVAEGSMVISNQISNIVVDGTLTDWAGAQAFATDPADTLSISNPIDYRSARLAHDNANFYLAYQIEQREVASINSWGFNTYIDTDRNVVTGYYGNDAIGAEFLLQGEYLYRYAGDGTSWSWSAVGKVDWATNGNAAEIGLPRTALGNPTDIDLVFVGDNLSVNNGLGFQLDLYPDGIFDPNAQPRYFSYTTQGILASDSDVPVFSTALAPEAPYNGSLALQGNPRQPARTSGSEQTGDTSPSQSSAATAVHAGSVGSGTLVLLSLLGFGRTRRRTLNQGQ